LISALGHGLSIPHNDGWAYAKIARGFADHLDFQLLAWNRPGLVGQVLLAVPLSHVLPDVVVAQHLTVWATGVALVLAGYRFFEPELGPSRAALVAATTGLFPALGLLSTSFMADVPAASLGMLCLAAGARAAERRSWLWTSLLLGLLASVTREQELAAPAAVLLWVGMRHVREGRTRQLRGVAVSGLAFLAAFLAVELWRRGLPYDSAPEVASTTRAAGYQLIRGALVLGLALIPVAALVASRPGRLRLPGILPLVACGSTLLVLAARRLTGRPEDFLPGNYVGGGRAAPYSDVGIGSPAAVLPDWFWVATAAMAGASLLVAVLAFANRGTSAVAGERSRLAAIFVLLYAGGLVAQTAAGQPFFDRYLLPLVPVAAGLCLAVAAPRPGRVRATSAAAAAAFLLLVGVEVVAAGTAYDAARWNASRALLRDGVPATDIAGGLEWSGWHSRERYRSPGKFREGGFWTASFADSRDCWIVAASPLRRRDLRLARTFRYDRLLLTAPSRLFVYRSGRCR
jgi:hypothetical protein